MTETPPPLRGPGRPPGFDRAVALETALDLLWAGGFEATPIGELIPRMGLSRSSFYAAFGSKRGVLLAAIRFYSERGIAALEEIGQSGAGRHAKLAHMVELIAKIDDIRGCFMVNCISELARRDPDIRRIAAAHTEALIAHVAGVMPPDDPRRMPRARAIVAGAYGATLLRTSGVDRTSVREMLATLVG